MYKTSITDDQSDALPCAEKLAFDTKKQANAIASVAMYRYGTKVYAYRCSYCELWHLASHQSED
jgi:hypothetical protein